MRVQFVNTITMEIFCLVCDINLGLLSKNVHVLYIKFTNICWYFMYFDSSLALFTLQSIKNTRPCCCYSNFGKCGLVFISHSLLHSGMNCGRRCYNSYHLTSSLLPHYHLQGGPKKTKLSYFVHIFAKYWPIFTIFSPVDSVGNLLLIGMHTTPTMSLHYLVKHKYPKTNNIVLSLVVTSSVMGQFKEIPRRKLKY